MALVYADTLRAIVKSNGHKVKLGTVLVGKGDKAVPHPAYQFPDKSIVVLFFGRWMHHSKVPDSDVSGFLKGYRT